MLAPPAANLAAGQQGCLHPLLSEPMPLVLPLLTS